VAFAKSGNPNAPGLAAWPMNAPAEDAFIEFGSAITTGKAWRAGQLDFLDHYHDRG
jgi:hypothetical protein